MHWSHPVLLIYVLTHSTQGQDSAPPANREQTNSSALIDEDHAALYADDSCRCRRNTFNIPDGMYARTIVFIKDGQALFTVEEICIRSVGLGIALPGDMYND